MPAITKTVEALLEEQTDVNIPVYLDVTSLSQFAVWGRANVADLVKRIKTDGLQIIVFDSQLKNAYRRTKYQSALKQLQTFEVEIDDEDWLTDDDVFATELESFYFHDESAPLCDVHAKFLVLARYASTTHMLRIVSAYPAFQRILNAEIYVLPTAMNHLDVPPNFDVFTDLQLHSRLVNTVSGHFRNGNYPTVVFEAAKELSQYLRDVSQLTTDGGTLANDALGLDVTRTTPKTVTRMPTVKLNSLGDDSEIEEQEGYWRYCLGVAKAIRNSNAHLTAADPFIVSRFSDKKTAIKVLCFLSLLFEKIDKRVP